MFITSQLQGSVNDLGECQYESSAVAREHYFRPAAAKVALARAKYGMAHKPKRDEHELIIFLSTKKTLPIGLGISGA